MRSRRRATQQTHQSRLQELPHLSPLTAASTLTKSKVCADHPFVRSAAHTHNENRTEVLCPRVTQAAMIAAASFGLRRSGTFATATSGAAYWAASVRHGPP